LIPSHIERETVIEAPLDVVWGILTQPVHIVRWFSDSADIDLRPGGGGAISWKEHGTFPVRVEKVEQPHLFSFRWVHTEGAEPREGNSTLVEFTLTAEGDSTRLRVVESGLRELDWPDERKDEFAGDHTQGWERILAGLREYASRQPEETVRR
jgi:uncharacterized protein YndB with AHSA1/START domain